MHVIHGQTGIGVGQHGDLQPLLLNGVVRPRKRDSVGPTFALTCANFKAVGCRYGGPGSRGCRIANREREVGGSQRAGRVGNIDHDPVDATTVAAVVGEGCQNAGQQSLFVGRDRSVVIGVHGRITDQCCRIVES